VEIVDQGAVHDIDAAGDASLCRDRHDPLFAGVVQGGEDAAADVVVDADDGGMPRALAMEEPPLCGDVTVHAAVAVEVVGRDVEQNRDVEHQVVRQFELVGAELQHVSVVSAERLEQQRGYAEIAAHRYLAAGFGQNVGGQGCGRRFAVGAGDAGKTRGL